MKNFIKEWLLPPKILNFILNYSNKRNLTYLKYRKLIKRNIQFKNIHKGDRCFILLNGPSINEEDLSLLKNEICFSVSNFFHNKDYVYIKPKYHVVPQILDINLSIEQQINWLNTMNEELVSDFFFLDITNYDTIKKNGLLKNQQLAFLSTSNTKRMFNISQRTKAYQTVPIMCLEIAIYMGFTEIYLLGGDFDAHCTGEYKYFFDRKKMEFNDPSVNSDNTVKDVTSVQMDSMLNVFYQFEEIKRYTDAKNIKIFNLSQRSKLDIFEKKKLCNLLKGKE